MNEELNQILLSTECDEWVLDNLMWQPGFEKGLCGYASTYGLSDIRDTGKSGDMRIYGVLKNIEKITGIKL